MAGYALSARRFDLRIALWLGCLICALVAEGLAVTHSYLWAAPLVCLLIVAVAIDLPLVPFLGLTLFVRVLTDASLSSPDIRHSGSLNLSAAIALLFILVAIGLLLRRRQGAWPAVLAVLWLGLWTGIAVNSHGPSTETIREGVREASIVALAVMVYNVRGTVSISAVTRLVQVVGIASALLALYQLATHSGLLILGEIRSNGTFVHPDGAAMFFAIATTASLWRYVDNGRRRSEALFTAIFAAATIATFSLTGLASLLAMLMAFGALRPGSFRVKLGAIAVAGLIVIAFLATPLGAKRIATQSSTQLSTAQSGGTGNTSLGWRLYKWGTLIREWKQAPLLGQGLGTTVTAADTVQNSAAGKAPHNEYLRYLVETGAVGLAILIGALVLLIRRLSARRWISGTPGAAALGIAIVVGCIVDALADNTFLYTTTGYAVALIIATVLSLPSSTAQRTPAMEAA